MLSEGLLLSLVLAAGPTAVSADSLPVLRLLALSPASETAVVGVQTEDGPGDPRLVRKGEEIGETGLTLIEVLPDRIEVRQELPAEAGAPSQDRLGDRRLWIYRSRGGGASRVQVLDQAAPPTPHLGAPLAIRPSAARGAADSSIFPDHGSSESSDPKSPPGSSSDSRSGKSAPASGGARR